MHLILASGSPRRKELLEKLNIPFDIIVSECDESLPQDTNAEEAARMLAERKAEAVARLYPEAVVIGADTTVILDNRILGKPKNHADCIETLQRLSGCTHSVITGVAIVKDGRTISFSDQTAVEFYALSEKEIQQYADLKEPYDKAGAYGIQGQGALLVRGIHGDYYNVMGLPIARLARKLQELQIIA
ncbi:MAG: Maf family protein [Oscillospiraceae bacterium]|nr:Maf family protein [Oscillospiraceae bacterium]